MGIKLDHVVPFGRSLAEYQLMFNLQPGDLQQQILGIADGPASFNAEATSLGGRVTSVDPLYDISGVDIQSRFEAVVDDIINQVKTSPASWVWDYHQSPEDLRRNREKTLQNFLADYDTGKRMGRYQVGQLPTLNFADQVFDLALCSHFLFLYSDHYDQDFHLRSIHELLRVSQEVRIFPLLTLESLRSHHLEPVIEALTTAGCQAEIVRVRYELQKGGNQMLVIRS